jgi:opacity protein-like surface antigen
MPRNSLLLSLFLALACSQGYGQEVSDSTDTAEYQGAFHKGRFLTALSGSFVSGITETAGVEEDQNEFLFSLKNGLFIKDRFPMGLNFVLQKEGSDNARTLNSTELFSVGPFFRYYLSKDPRASVYPELSLLFTRFRNELDLTDPSNNRISTQTRGNGVSFQFGIGFTYAITPHVGFDLTFQYQYAGIDATITDRITDEVESDIVTFNNFIFNFGFVVLLDEFFF